MRVHSERERRRCRVVLAVRTREHATPELCAGSSFPISTVIKKANLQHGVAPSSFRFLLQIVYHPIAEHAHIKSPSMGTYVGEKIIPGKSSWKASFSSPKITPH